MAEEYFNFDWLPEEKGFYTFLITAFADATFCKMSVSWPTESRYSGNMYLLANKSYEASLNVHDFVDEEEDYDEKTGILHLVSPKLYSLNYDWNASGLPSIQGETRVRYDRLLLREFSISSERFKKPFRESFLSILQQYYDGWFNHNPMTLEELSEKTQKTS